MEAFERITGVRQSQTPAAFFTILINLAFVCLIGILVIFGGVNIMNEEDKYLGITFIVGAGGLIIPCIYINRKRCREQNTASSALVLQGPTGVQAPPVPPGYIFPPGATQAPPGYPLPPEATQGAPGYPLQAGATQGTAEYPPAINCPLPPGYTLPPGTYAPPTYSYAPPPAYAYQHPVGENEAPPGIPPPSYQQVKDDK